MKLFRYEGYKLTISEEALTLKPFKQIWNRDRTANKEKALMEMGYIYFMVDPRSDYQIYVDPEVRSKEIIDGEGINSNWKPDKLVNEAMTFYAKFKPASALLLEDTRYMVDRFRARMRDAVANEELDVKDLKDISALIKGIPGLVKDLDEAERTVAKEIVQSDKIRGASEKSMYEDL